MTQPQFFRNWGWALDREGPRTERGFRSLPAVGREEAECF